MLYPTISELTKDEFNRYELALATAKCARIITDEYVQQREKADELISRKETEKPLIMLIDKEYRTEKPVRIAINRFHEGTYEVHNAPNADGTIDVPAEEEQQ